MNYDLTQKFKNDLQKIAGKKCWGIVGGNGSIIAFDFGKKIPREKPIINENLSNDEQKFESEFSLFVHCVWRVDSAKDVIFGAWTEYEIIQQKLNQILNQTVKQIDLYEPAFDLKITFSNDFKLNIFCDQTNEEDNNDNYDYFTPEIIYTVGYKSNLETSKHD